jgi:threonine dehydratase
MKSNAVYISKTDIENTYNRIAGYINKTALITSQTVNHIVGAKIYFKCENFQKAGAFKFRGATNAILKLKENTGTASVCTHSSGNHAQALALASSVHGFDSYIVMPDNAPKVKVDAVKAYGGKITFCKPTLQAREDTLKMVKEKTQATVIHPYNNYDVIEGQATCFFESLTQCSSTPDFLVCPVGGGGLLSGSLLSAKYFSPKTKVIAAEPEMANDAWKSFKSKKLILSENPNTIADGLKTSLGSYTWPIIRDNAYDILTASEESIIKAMHFIWERMKIVIEPSAAVSLAVVFDNQKVFSGKNVLIILSGGNVDLQRLPWQ